MNRLNSTYNTFKQVPEKYLIVLAFAIIYSLVSLVNHFLFRTYALDLGIYSNALYDYSHFQWNDSGVFKMEPQNLMGDHFDFYLMLYSPFVWIFGSYTLLIFQIVSILFGGLGVYRYFRENRILAMNAMLFFYSFFGVYTALSYDFHDSVVVAMLVPWLFVFTKERKMKWAAFFVVLLWLGKENSALWIAFVCFGLSILNWKEGKWRFFFIIYGFVSLLYFVILMKFVMPALAADGIYPHFDYSVLGATMPEAISYLIVHPVDSFQLMVSNFNGDSMGDNTKSDLLKFLLFSGIALLLFRPAYLLMLIPIFFQKLFHDSMAIWGAGFHYCIEFTPILAIGVFEVVDKLKKESFKSVAGGILVVLALVMTNKRLSHQYLYAPNNNLNFLSKDHYKKEYNVKPVYEAFKLIPKDAVVSSQSNLVPHLANRDFCYMYPIVKDAEYVILAKKDTPYPLRDSIFQVEIRNFQQSKEWIKLVDNDEVLLLKRKN
ncbi:DUF2079 domain-containing protein [Fluviicola chungangensis]|uniref:DUF2079 domain-containing protein n=1 Tax=Fluviicola chungangensis TaxID=2597671 RepID=A0A556MRA5_9FLAO|nr:DUF2079 domain-containing protein [Fluviicola chungangensis]TSJ42309.1 DUF2079 domain-containing protein [Fluviicola chungangensis]